MEVPPSGQRGGQTAGNQIEVEGGAQEEEENLDDANNDSSTSFDLDEIEVTQKDFVQDTSSKA